MRHRGFTILELAISMAIAGIVVAAATTAAVNVTRLLKLEGKKSIADQDSRRLVDFVIGRMQASGGGPVRPWMAMWHEQACVPRNGLPNCNGHDRLTVIDVDLDRNDCAIVSMTDSELVFADPGDGTCCFDWPPEALPDSLQPDQFHGQSLMVVGDRNEWMMVVATDAGERSGLNPCTYGLSGIKPLQNWADAQQTVAAFNDGDAVAVPVAARTLYVGPNLASLGGGAVLPSPLLAAPLAVEALPPEHLLEWFDDNRNMILDAGESRVVFPGVYDFQIALGYDDPEDGRVADTGTTADEWWGNATETGAVTLARPTLRMGGVGVIVGVKAVEPGAKTMSVLNGPTFTRNTYVMRKAQGKAMLRNIAVFY